MKRQYSLFAKFDGKHKRVSAAAYSIEDARRIFQNRLLVGSLSGIEMNLKPIIDSKPVFDNDAYEIYMTKLGMKKCKHCWEFRLAREFNDSEVCHQCGIN